MEVAAKLNAALRDVKKGFPLPSVKLSTASIETIGLTTLSDQTRKRTHTTCRRLSSADT